MASDSQIFQENDSWILKKITLTSEKTWENIQTSPRIKEKPARNQKIVFSNSQAKETSAKKLKKFSLRISQEDRVGFSNISGKSR